MVSLSLPDGASYPHHSEVGCAPPVGHNDHGIPIMATDDMESEIIHALVANIPPDFHSSDIRKFFSKFIENQGFHCFHFKHRPEGRNPNEQNRNDNVSETSIGTSKPSFGFTIDKYTKKDKHKSTVVKSQKTCCIVKLRSSKYLELVQLYHKKHWIGKNGKSIPSLCFISKMKVASSLESNEISPDKQVAVDDTDATADKPADDQHNHKSSIKNTHILTENDIEQLPELRPPHVMPNGNVGTPSSVFLELIRKCLLPSKIIKSLGLTFPKSSTKGVYSNVMFDYKSTDKWRQKKMRKTDTVTSQTQDDEPETSTEDTQIPESSDFSKNESVTDTPTNHQNNENNSDVEERNSESEEDVDECEEWDRHEALHDDPANIERNKERKYEENLEVVWEKGGPGLVWYTDEQYWREQDGDFDEQTVDDWDVDMGVYYEEFGGDKDARDMVTMRRDTRRRKGHIEQESVHRTRIGCFEKHTKGIGRKVMERQGWMDGSGLGTSSEGMAEALDNDGQKPFDKTGFGYRGEKLRTYPSTSRPKRIRRSPDDVIISTVYDKPEHMEIKETLLRRTDHKTMSYRDQVRVWKPNEQPE